MQHFLPKIWFWNLYRQDFFSSSVATRHQNFSFNKNLSLEHNDIRDARDLHHQRDKGVTEQLVKEVHHGAALVHHFKETHFGGSAYLTSRNDLQPQL